jgi:hypothetical protein
VLKRLLFLLTLTIVARSATAQFRGEATYHIGVAATDIGEDEASGDLAYGMGVGASYGFWRDRSLGIVVGGEFAVRAFAVEIPGQGAKGAGVFDQSDLLLGEFVGLRFSLIVVGAYFEQRRIHRGAEFGTLGFPVRGVGFTVRAPLSSSGATAARFEYASLIDGQFQLRGIDVEPSLDSGRSFRITISHQIGPRFGVRAAYSDIRLELDRVLPTLSLFDHHQRAFFAGAVILF